MKLWAKVLGDFEAIHQWQNGESKEWDQYLRWLHRHLFKVVVWIEQKHDDREIEYYAFKTWLKGILETMQKPKWSSCEMYCEQVARIIQQSYKDRAIRIEITEDGYEGAQAEYEAGELAGNKETRPAV